MKSRDFGHKLQKLREEKEHFLNLIGSLDRKVSLQEITRYQRQFTINSITRGISEQEYLRHLEKEILENEKLASEERSNDPMLKNILIVGIGVMIIILLLIALIIPEMDRLSQGEIKEFNIPVNMKYYSVGNDLVQNTFAINASEKTAITSLKMNGSFSGNARIYLVVNSTGEKYLIFDSGKYDSKIISITGNLFIIKGDPGAKGIELRNVCDETCKISIDPSDVYVLVDVSSGGFVAIDDITYSQPVPNKPPVQAKMMDDVLLIGTMSRSIDVSSVFSDPEGEKLSYSLSNVPDIRMSAQGDILTFNAPKDVELNLTAFIYVSDGKNKINSNVFRIVVNTTFARSGGNGVDDVSEKDKKNNSADGSTGKLKPVAINRTIDINSPLSGKNTLDNSSLSNRTTNIEMETYLRNKYYKGFAFKLDPKLMSLWAKDPSANPRVIIAYKDGGNVPVDVYLKNLRTELDSKKSASPQDFNKTSLDSRREELMARIQASKESLNPADPAMTKNSVNPVNSAISQQDSKPSSPITGNLVIEPSYTANANESASAVSAESASLELDSLNAELELIDYKIASLEVYDSLNAQSQTVNSISEESYIDNSSFEAVKTNYSGINLLKFNSAIGAVFLDEPVESLMAQALERTRIPETKLYPQNILDGSNITICLLDTGIDPSVVKNDFVGYNFISGNNDSMDDNGHGTAVGYILYNIVPKAKLIVAKVLDSHAQGFESSVLSGLEYCHMQNATIISMSIGSSGYDGYCDNDPVAQYVDQLDDEGIIVVAATGNNASGFIKSPACARKAIPVGASSIDDTLAPFTDYDGNVLLLAPGVDIDTLGIGSLEVTASGTSMSVPFISGTIALLEQYNRENMIFNSSDDLKRLLAHSGNLIDYPGDTTGNTTRYAQTFARLDAYNAISGNITNNLTAEDINATEYYDGPFTGLTEISSCGATLTADTYYNLTGNISVNGSNCLNVTASNVTIDCNGYSISGNNTPGTSGIYVANSNAITIQNCNISGMDYAIYFSSVGNSTINDVTAASTTNYTLVLYQSSNNSILNTNASGIDYSAMYIYSTSSNNTLSNVALTSSTDNALELRGNNNTVSNSVITSLSWDAIFLSGTTSNSFSNCNISGYKAGLHIFNSNSNIFNNCNIISSDDNTVYLDGTSSLNNFSNSILSSYANSVIYIDSNTITNNIFYNNTVNTTGNNYDIYMQDGLSNVFYSNTFISPANSLVYLSTSSAYNVFYRNNFTATSSYYINNNNETNMFNTTVNGAAQGNYYYNISTLRIYDTNGDGWGDAGTDYPLSNTTWTTKWKNYGADYGPATTRTALMCGALSTAGANYSLDLNVSANGTCFTVTAENVTLDCQGYAIYDSMNGSSGYYGIYSNKYNTTIKNCKIFGAGYAIYLSSAGNSIINNVNASSITNYVVYLSQSSNNTILNSNFTGGENSSAIRINTNSNNNTLTNVIATSVTDSALNIYGNDNIINNSIFTSSKWDAVYFSGATNNSFSNCIFSANHSGLHIYSSNGNIFTNCSIISNGSSAIGFDGTSSQNNFSNSLMLSYNSMVITDNPANSNNTFYNNTVNATGSHYDLYINGANNTFDSNNFISPTYTQVYLLTASNYNIFYHNNFSQTTNYYINNLNETNQFNTTIGAVPQGNFYYNISSKNISDTNGDGWGDAGSDYPLNSSTWSTKWSGLGADYGPAITSSANMITVRISPSNPHTNDTILGFCNGTITAGSNVTYNYSWYLNNTLNSSGNAPINYTSGTEVNVANISSASLLVGQVWILGCLVTNGTSSSSWMNSSNVTILSSISANYESPTPANNANTANTSTIINISVNSSSPLQQFIWDWNGANYSIYDNDLVLSMDFDNVSALGEGSNTFSYDASKYGNNGTCSNMGAVCNYTSGRYGKGISFDGATAQYVNISSTPSLTLPANYTLIAWIYPRGWGQGGYGRIFDKSDSSGHASGYALFISDSYIGTINALYIIHYNESGPHAVSSNNNMINLNIWQQVAATYNGTGVAFYVNGVFAGYNNSVDGMTLDSTDPLLIGMRLSNDMEFNGIIDAVRIYNRSLSASEINETYYSNLNKYDTAKWLFYVNQSYAANAQYAYYGYAKDSAGNSKTDTRTLNALGNAICGMTFSANAVYNMSGNLSINGSTCLTVNKSNVTIDCNGYSISGNNTPGTSGIYAGNSKSIIIKNCNIYNMDYAIFFSYVNDSNMTNINASSTTNDAVLLQNSLNNSISNSNFTANDSNGIDINSNSNNNIVSNVIATSAADSALRFGGSSANNLLNNSIIISNWDGIYLSGATNNSFVNSNITGYNLGLHILSSTGNKFNKCNIIANFSSTISFDGACSQNNFSNSQLLSYSMVITDTSTDSNNIFYNNTLNTTSTYRGLDIQGSNNTFDSNTFIIPTALPVYLEASSMYNQFYHNNFTSTSSYYINNNNETNMFNTTVNGAAQGNYYYNISTLRIYDTNGDGWGDYGADYPLNATTWSSVWSGLGADYGPATTKTTTLCGTLSTAGATYSLALNATSNGTCFSITAENITLDCKGYTITYAINGSLNYGINSSKYNTTIKNCNIVDGNITGVANRNGIYFIGSSINSAIYNCSVNTSNSPGIRANTASTTIMNNIFISTSSIGMYIASSNNILINNTGKSLGATQGIYLVSNSNNTLINNTGISSSGAGINLFTSSNNNLTNNTALSATGRGIYIQSNSNNNTLTNNIGNSSTGAAGIDLTGSNNNTLVNNTGAAGTTGKGIILESNSYNNTLTQNLGRSGSNNGMLIQVNSSNNNFTNNTLQSASGTLLFIDSTSGNNIFYYNNFTQTTGYYINNSNSTNMFNTSAGTVPQGNYYYNISSLKIYDTNADGWGDVGTDYPLSNTTWSTKWAGLGTDYGPATNRKVTIASARISPPTPQTIDTLTGYCNGSESTGINIYYNYAWYLNGASNTSGTTTQNYSSNTEVNIANISSTQLAAGQNWTLGCSANINGVNSSWTNSSTVNITAYNYYPSIIYNNNTDTSGIISRSYIIVNVSANDSDLNNLTIAIYNSTGQLINSTLTTQSNLFINYTVPSDGIYYFNATAYDSIGQKNSTSTRNITIDRIAPNLNYISPTDNGTVARTYVYISINITELNIANLTIYLFNSTGSQILSNVTYGINVVYTNFTGLSDGTYYYNATAYDLANNIGYASTANITIYTIPPNASIISPLAGSWQNKNFNITYNATDALIDTCLLYTRNGTAGIWTSRGTITCGNLQNATIIVNSTGYCSVEQLNGCGVRILANNTLSNSATAERNYSIDYSGPIFGAINIHNGTISTNGPTTYYKGMINISVTANDSVSGINTSSCQYTTDNSNYNVADGYNGTHCYTSITPGADININFKTTDNASNTATGANKTLIYDTTPPATTANANNSDGSTYTFGTFTVSAYVNIILSCNDTLSGCNKTIYCTDTTNNCTPNTIYTGTPIQVNTSGTSYIRYYSNDSLNNIETINNQTINLSTIYCGMTFSANSIYSLSQNLSTNGTCFTVAAENVTVDCQGYTITYSINGSANNYGIYTNKYNTTIQNCNIIDGNITTSGGNRHAIYITGGSNSLLSNNTVNTSTHAIRVATSSIRIINNIAISNTGAGILLSGGSSNNILTNNTAKANGSNSAILLQSNSNNNTLINNTGIGNNGGSGIMLDTNSNNNLTDNKGISYTDNGIYLSNSNNNILTNNIGNATIGSYSQGIYLSGSNNNTLINNTGISNTGKGIKLETSSNNNLTKNYGIALGSSNGIIIQTNSNNNTLNNNTLQSTSGTLLIIDATSGNNLFYYNNFKQTTGYYIDNSNSTNMFNTSVTGTPQGNYYYNITSKNIYDTNGDGWSDYGTDYPLSNITWSTKWKSYGTDYGPATTKTEYAPVIQSSTILPSPTYNNESLRGYCNATDADNNNLTYIYRWFLNGLLNMSGSTANYTQGIGVNIGNISNSSLAIGQNWTLECQANDSMMTSSRLNSTTIMIQLMTPSIPSLVSPANGDITIHGRQPLMIWNNSALATWYEINITSNNCAGSSTNSTNIGSVQSNYTPASKLCLQTEGGGASSTYYNWTVRACNPQACSNWSAMWNFSIEPYLAITLINNTVTFPALQPGDSANTTSLIIAPFQFRNDGNVYSNLTNVTINQSMWTNAALGTQYLQIEAGNTSESGSFDTGTSTMNWVNATDTNNNTITNLNYDIGARSAYIHVLIQVPTQEPAGSKTTYFTFNWI